MHEIEHLDGDLNDTVVRGTDWVWSGPDRARYVRPTGYRGTRTAELVFTPLGWIGISYLLTPHRTGWFRPTAMADRRADAAAYALELAEAAGHGSPVWLPLRPAHVPEGWHGGGDYPGQHRSYMRMVDNQVVTVVEVCPSHFIAMIGDVLMTAHDGNPILFDSPADVLDYMHGDLPSGGF